MSKITPEHLARQAVVYIRRSRQLARSPTIWKASAGSIWTLRRSGASARLERCRHYRRRSWPLRRRRCATRLREAAGCHLRRACRRRCLDRGVAPGSQRGRDWRAHYCWSSAVCGRYADCRRGRRSTIRVSPNDRLLLGLKGTTMSEMELSVLRQRLRLEALKQKRAPRANCSTMTASPSATYGSATTASRRTRIGALRKPSRSCSRSLPRCSRCVRCTCGSGTSTSRCLPSPTVRKGA